MSDPVALGLIGAFVTIGGNFLLGWRASIAAKAAARAAEAATQAAMGAAKAAKESAIASAENKEAIERVHGALDGQLDAYKKEAADQYTASLNQMQEIVTAKARQEVAEKTAEMLATIADLKARVAIAAPKFVVAGPNVPAPSQAAMLDSISIAAAAGSAALANGGSTAPVDLEAQLAAAAVAATR